LDSEREHPLLGVNYEVREIERVCVCVPVPLQNVGHPLLGVNYEVREIDREGERVCVFVFRKRSVIMECIGDEHF